MFEVNLKNPIPISQANGHFSEPYFHDNLTLEYFFKAITASLLESCGYTIYPYGYETFFPNLKGKLNSINGDSACSQDLVSCRPRSLSKDTMQV
jgi:hypothetical protein